MERGRGPIVAARERESVQVLLPDGRVFEARRETPLAEFFHTAFSDRTNPPVAAIVDGELRELGCPVTRDVEATPVFLSESDGMRIYYRSLSFLLIVAAYELFPKARGPDRRPGNS